VVQPATVTMRVLLVSPYEGFLPGRKGPVYSRAFPPVCLASLAGVLRARGHEVSLLDAASEGLWPHEIAARARGFDRAVINSSSLDRWCCPDVDPAPFVESDRLLTRVVPRTVLSGAHPTALPAAMLRSTGAWAAVIGEPEASVPELLEAPAPEGVAGAAWLDGEGGLRRGPPRPPVRLDTLPLPAYDLLAGGGYRYELLGGDFMVFERSRGCPHACGFCQRSVYGPGFREKPIDQLWAEIEAARLTLGVRTAYFIDTEFTLRRRRVLELCERLQAAGNPLRWCCQTRVDLVDPALLRIMRASGCELVHYGVESGSQRVLDTMGKGTTLAQARQALAWTHAAGLRSACFFLAGMPGETPGEREETLRFALELGPSYASFHVVVPYPGTALFEGVSDPPAERFPTHVDEHDLGALEAWTHRAFLRFYLRPGYALGRLVSRDLLQAPRLLRILGWYLT
jgi:anaerobic magnesium-protoporphyrin IX monomethyl ester cyclase